MNEFNMPVVTRLNMVINALNTVTVSGKQNCANISGSIDILEGIVAEMSQAVTAEEEK